MKALKHQFVLMLSCFNDFMMSGIMPYRRKKVNDGAKLKINVPLGVPLLDKTVFFCYTKLIFNPTSMVEQLGRPQPDTSPKAYSQTEIAPAVSKRPDWEVLEGGLSNKRTELTPEKGSEKPLLDELTTSLQQAVAEAPSKQEAATKVAELLAPQLEKLKPNEALALEFTLKFADLQGEPVLQETLNSLKQLHGNEPKEDPIAVEQKKLGEATDTSQYLIEAIQGQDEAKRTSALGEARSRVGVWRKYIDSLPSELKTGPDARDFETIVHELEVEIKMDDEKKLGQARDKVEKA